MDSSWIVAVGILGGVAAWAYSQKSDSPDESGESTTELQNSDKPSFSSLERTNPARYQGWKEWINTFDTTCGWTPEEEYCPNGIVNASDCNSIAGWEGENCTRVFYQLTEDQKNIAFGSHRTYSNWTEEAENCGDLEGLSNFCVWPFPMETVNPPGCDPIRGRAKYPDFMQSSSFDVNVDMQILGLVDNFTSCDPDWPIYAWCSEEYIDREYAIKIDRIELKGGITGGRVLARVQVDNSTVPPTYVVENVSNWSPRQQVSSGTWDVDFECFDGVSDGDAWEDKSGTYPYTYTRQTFTVDADNSDGYYNGVYDLEVQLNIGREIDSALPEWAEGCEFDVTVNLTIPNYVLMYSPELCENCEGGKIVMDNFCGCYGAFCSDDDKDCDIRAKYYYTQLSSGELERISAWGEAPNSARCGGTRGGGINCTDESQDEYNAECIFPRNGFMIW